MDIEFPYILGGDLVLTVTATVTPECEATRIDPPQAREMEITEVLLPDGKTFESNDIYIIGKCRVKFVHLDTLIEEDGWEYYDNMPSEDGPDEESYL